MLKDLLENYRLGLSAVIAISAELVLIVCSFAIGSSWDDVIITLSLLILAYAIGSLIGTAISPYDKAEKERFSTYVGAVSVFFSGYLVSKLDGLITTAVSKDAIGALTSLGIFRVVAFTATLLIAAKVTFLF